MKKWCTLLLSFVLCFALGQNTFAVEVDFENQFSCGNTAILTATGKTAFVENVTKQYSDLKTLERQVTYDVDQVNSLMMEVAFAESQTIREMYLNKLEELGIYRYSLENCNTPTPMSDSHDIYFDNTEAYYSVQEKVWIITSSGRWRTEEWHNEKPATGGNVGCPDVFGVGFTNVSGKYNARVVRCYGVLRNGWDGEQRRARDTYNRGGGDGATGFYFKLQDSIEMVDTTNKRAALEDTYIGSEWFASCTYSDEFTEYSGIATGFYVHTWNKAVITGVELGVQDKTAGLVVKITNQSFSFPAYGIDVKF